MVSTDFSMEKVFHIMGNYWNGSNHGSVTGCAVLLKYDGTIWGSGQNGTGTLGVGDATSRTSWTQSVSAPAGTVNIFMGGGGYYSGATFALTSGGQLYSTGHNWSGNLGVGDATQRNTFTLCVMPTGVQGTILEVKTCYSSRYSFTVARSSNGKLYGAGHSMGIWTAGNGQFNQFNSIPMPNGIGIKEYMLTDTGAGNYETGFGLFVLSTAGELFAAGNNTYCQLGRFTRRAINGLNPVAI